MPVPCFHIIALDDSWSEQCSEFLQKPVYIGK